jgi:acyl-CoA thioester hydrolase
MKGAPMKGKTQPVRPMLIHKPLKINGYDIDVMGIVSNIVYIRWFEDLRFEFLDRYWPFENMLKSNRSPVLSTTHVKYRYPLTIYDRPFGMLWISDLGRAKWTVSIEIATEERINCTGTQTGYFLDLTTKRPVPLPTELRKEYERLTSQ